MNKLILSIILIVISIIGIKSYTPSILSSYTFDSKLARWVYTQVPLDTGKTTTNQVIPISEGVTILGSLTQPDDNGNALIIINDQGSLNLVNYNIESNVVTIKTELKDFVPYEYSISPYGYDSTNNIAYHSTLYWNSSQGNPTYLGIMILNYATGYADVVSLNVALNLTTIVGTYNSEDQIYYAYYSDQNGNDHLVAFNTATNQSIDNKLKTPSSPSTAGTLPITEVFYYDGNVYLCKLFINGGVVISRVDVTDFYAVYSYYSDDTLPYSNVVNPFIFDSNGCITIISPTNNQQLNYWILNIQPFFVTEGTTPTNQVPAYSWIINTM